MLVVYIIAYFLSTLFYHLKYNYVASVIMISLAIFLYLKEIKYTNRIINVRGLFALGFIGGFGVSLLKLSKLSNDYSIMTFVVVFTAYFAVYLGTFYRSKNSDNKEVNADKSSNAIKELDEPSRKVLAEDILMILLFVFTFVSFVIEVTILKFIPLFTVDTPHAYSTFHVFMIHYITTFYSFIPCFAISNYFRNPNRKMNKIWIVISYIYVIIMAILMVSRSRLILCIVLSIFIIIINKQNDLKNILSNKKNILLMLLLSVFVLALYVIITINRAHDIEYLNGIFEMKNENTPIFITQPYMYIAQNFENLNYMINNVFRFTFGRRVLYPLFTLTLIKKFFPLVLDAPVYIIKEELSTLTIVYDFYYDFGIIGVFIFCFLIGYIGKYLEDRTYMRVSEMKGNNYIVILYSLYCYFMFFSFFQTYFSLTDTWVYMIILFLLSRDKLYTWFQKFNYNQKL